MFLLNNDDQEANCKIQKSFEFDTIIYIFKILYSNHQDIFKKYKAFILRVHIYKTNFIIILDYKWSVHNLHVYISMVIINVYVS